jgi:predicted PurR-regulated permease PerM
MVPYPVGVSSVPLDAHCLNIAVKAPPNNRSKAQPSFRQEASLLETPIDVRSIALTGIFVLLLLYSVYFAREFLIPVTLAFLLSWLLAPIVRYLAHVRIPQFLGAAIVLLALVGLVGYGAYSLVTPAAAWIQKAPGSLRVVQKKLQDIMRPVEAARETTKKIEKMTSFGDDKTATVEIKKPGLGEVVFSGTQNFLFWGGVTIVLLYFLLASGDLFLLKFVRVLPTLEDKKRAVEIVRQIESDVTIYLSTVTLVNFGLGACVGAAMYFLGMPNPLLWGVMVAFLNYIPYLGALAGIIILTVIAILTFDDFTRIALVPSVYFVLNFIEAYFVTPTVLGRRLALNPVMIFVWLIFWGWVWGVVGAILAVPILAIVKIVADHFKSLAALGEFLGTEEVKTTAS